MMREDGFSPFGSGIVPVSPREQKDILALFEEAERQLSRVDKVLAALHGKPHQEEPE